MFVMLVLLLNICNCIKSNIICPVTEQNIQEVCDGQYVAWIPDYLSERPLCGRRQETFLYSL